MKNGACKNTKKNPIKKIPNRLGRGFFDFRGFLDCCTIPQISNHLQLVIVIKDNVLHK